MELTIGEDHTELEQSALPKSLVLAWNATLPDLQVENTLSIALRFSKEAKWMISSPLLSLLLKPVLTERHPVVAL